MTVDELMVRLIQLDAPEAEVTIVLDTGEKYVHLAGVKDVRQFEASVTLVPAGVHDPWGEPIFWPPYSEEQR